MEHVNDWWFFLLLLLLLLLLFFCCFFVFLYFGDIYKGGLWEDDLDVCTLYSNT